ncbi:MAG: hypothetical protein KC493_01245 [Bacteriovoracaceae bacterium]|nr:hypothetical protein [Bacteriovoracaceae bacterium]
MKLLLVLVLSLSLIQTSLTPWGQAYAEGGDEETVFETPSSEGDQAILEMLEQVVPLCKDDRGNWKQEVIKVPMTDEDFNCTSLMKMEFDMLNEAGTPEGEKHALQCVTRGMDAQGRLEFARALESMDALSLGLDEHFNCPGKNQDMKSCLGDITCNAVNMITDQFTGGIASKVAQAFGSKSGVCSASTTQTNCFNELIWGIVKNITSNIEGLFSLGKLALDGIKSGYNAVKSWFSRDSGIEEPSREQHIALQQEQDKGILEWVSDAAKKVKEKIGGFFSAMGTFIDQGIKDNFGCAEWSENRYSPIYGGKPRCLKPVVSWNCATCSQRMNMACGIAGYAGGEIVTAYLTGGALALGKAAVKAGAATKIAKAAAATKAFKILATGSKYAAKPFMYAGKAAIGVLKFSGKVGMGIMRVGRKWMLKIGTRMLPISKAGKMKVLRMLLKGERAAIRGITFLPKKYFGAMERAFVAGYHSVDGIKYLAKARAVGRQSAVMRGNEVLDFTTDSSKFNVMKGQFVKNQDEYNRLLQEYNKTIGNLRQLGPDETARITADQIRRLNQLETDNLRLMTQLVDERRVIQTTAATTNNATDITLTANRVDNSVQTTTVVNRVDDTRQVVRTNQGNSVVRNSLDDLGDAGRVTNVGDDAVRSFRVGDQVDLRYKTGRHDKSAIVLAETDKKLKVRYPGEAQSKFHWIEKSNLDLKTTRAYNTRAFVGDDVVVPYRASNGTLARIEAQGAKGDVIQLTYKNPSNGLNGRISGEIIKETKDTIWIRNASNPAGRKINKSFLDLAKTRNFNDTRHLLVTRNLQAGDPIRLSSKGSEISGDVVIVHQKSIHIKDSQGVLHKIRMRDIDKSSIFSTAISPTSGVRLASTNRAVQTTDEIISGTGQSSRVALTTDNVAPTTVVVDNAVTQVSRTSRVSSAVKAKYTAITNQVKPLVGKAQNVVFNLKSNVKQVGRILSQGTDHIILKTAAGNTRILYKDVLKLTIPGRLSLALDGATPVLTNYSNNTVVDNDETLLPTAGSGYVLAVTGVLGEDKNSVSCIAKVTKDGNEIAEADIKDNLSLKWTGQQCDNKLNCNGKLSEQFNNIDVILEVEGVPEADWKKAKCHVTEPVVVDPSLYTLALNSEVNGNVLTCNVRVLKAGEEVDMTQDGKKLIWKGHEEKCNNGPECSGDINLGFKDVRIELAIDGVEPALLPHTTCSGVPARDYTWEIFQTKTPSDTDLICKFEIKKNGQPAALDEGMTLEFSDSEKCNAETMTCTGKLTEVEQFTGTIKKEGDDNVSVTCKKDEPEPEPEPDPIAWGLEVEYSYDKDSKEHECKAKVEMDDSSVSQSRLKDKGYTITWDGKEGCTNGKYKCSFERKEDESFNGLDVKIMKIGDSEEVALASEICANESTDDIYNDGDEDEDEDSGPTYMGPYHDYGPGTPLVPPQPMMLPPPMTYFHSNFN